MKTERISIAKDFSRYPAGRKRSDGPFSGEEFRERILLPALRHSDSVEIALDGVIGYGSSFLEEAFGGTIRELKISPEEFLGRVSIDSKDPSLINEIEEYVRNSCQGFGDNGAPNGL